MSAESPILIGEIPFAQNKEGDWIGTIPGLFNVTVNLGLGRPSEDNEYVAKTIAALKTPRGIEELVNSMELGPTITIDKEQNWFAWGDARKTREGILFQLRYAMI